MHYHTKVLRMWHSISYLAKASLHSKPAHHFQASLPPEVGGPAMEVMPPYRKMAAPSPATRVFRSWGFFLQYIVRSALSSRGFPSSDSSMGMQLRSCGALHAAQIAMQPRSCSAQWEAHLVASATRGMLGANAMGHR